MRDPKRIEIVLNEIKEIWNKNPDLRLCQLILNLCTDPRGLYYIEDDILIKALKEVYII